MQRVYIERISTLFAANASITPTRVASADILAAFSDWCHRTRTHLNLVNDLPDKRVIQPANASKIVAIPELGALHHPMNPAPARSAWKARPALSVWPWCARFRRDVEMWPIDLLTAVGL